MKQYRAVWISDLHLGSSACKHEFLHQFLKHLDCEVLFLNGDIIDLWAMARGGYYLSQEHVNIVRKILSMAKRGTKIKYTLGNHEDHLRKYHNFDHPLLFGNIEIANEFVHDCLDGEKLWVVHGDLYDGLVKHYRWIALIGDMSYSALIWFNGIFNKIRRQLGFNYWSLSQVIKEKVKNAIAYVYEYEHLLAKECLKKGYTKVCTGHIHVPAVKQFDSVTYYNSGDWVENCTAIVEHYDGSFELISCHD